VALCLSDAVKDTTYGTAGRRHGQLLMMVKDYYCCCTVCTALLFSYSAIFIAASVRNKLIHSKDGEWTQRSAADLTLVMMTMMSARLLTLCTLVKIATFKNQRCKTKSGDLHPRKLMSISRSISSWKIVNLHIINICCPKKWGGDKTLRPPTSKSGGNLSPCPPYDRRPCTLQ